MSASTQINAEASEHGRQASQEPIVDTHYPRTDTAAVRRCHGPIHVARFHSDAGLLTKVLSRTPDGTLEKRNAVYLSSGTVENLTLETFDMFGELLNNLTHDQALTYGVSLRGSGPVMSEKKWMASGNPMGTLLRNRDHFDWLGAGGVLMLDHDPLKDGKALSRDDLLGILYRALPEAQTAAHYWRPSAGSCIYDTTTGAELVGIRGQRIYIWLDDASEVPRVGRLLENRLWLLGHGHIVVTKGGGRVERTVFDGSVWQPERLDFAAGAKCEPPLEQRRPAPLRLGGQGPLDARALLDLPEVDRQRVDRLKSAAKDAKKEEARQIREARAQEKGRELQKSRGLDEVTALRVARIAYKDQRLMADFTLVSQDGVDVTVEEVLNDPKTWHAERFREPLEPDYPDERIAIVNLLSGGRPYIWSHAHGGTRYELCRAVATVQVSNGATAHATEQTLGLMRDGTTYYERGNDVVVVTEAGAAQPLGQYALKQRLERDISFQKWDAREKKLKDVDCPDEVARRVLDMRGDRGLPMLAGIVQYPTMTPEGRLLERPGYDDETRLLLLNPNGRLWPRVPARPTEEQVLAALGRLWAPVSKFPFIDEASRGITLAALLTAVVRRTLPTSPAFMFAAPAAGSGKTLLASCILELVGYTTAMSLPDNEAELQKTLVSHLRKGPSALFFDNVVGVVDSKALNAMLTLPTYEGRILGVSMTSGALPTNLLVLLTGNNARPAGDTCRRMLVANIDPGVEQPYLRQFEFDPVYRMRAHRMEMVTDALTILCGWMSSGIGRVAKGNLASFEAWDGLVRQAVVWVGHLERRVSSNLAIGFGDPAATIEAQYADDDDTEALAGVLEAWFVVQPGDGLKAAELYRELEAARRGTLDPLGVALLEAMPKVQSSKGLSRWLKNVKGRVVRNLRVEGDFDKAKNNTSWFVRRA